MREDIEQELLVECNNFKPTINQNSKKLDRLKITAEFERSQFNSLDSARLTLVPRGARKRGSPKGRKAALAAGQGEENVESDDSESAQLVNQSNMIQNPLCNYDRFNELYENASATRAKIAHYREQFIRNEASFQPEIFTRKRSDQHKRSSTLSQQQYVGVQNGEL